MQLGSGGGGTAKVPIYAAVANDGLGTYNNQPCTVYSFQVSSSDGAAHSGVSLTPTSGATISLNSISVPATGSVQLYVYVPTTLTDAVNVTASAAGYLNNVFPVCGTQ